MCQPRSWLIFDVGQKMKALLPIVCLLGCSLALAASPDTWIVEPPREVAISKVPAIPTVDVFEVVASKHSLATGDLRKIAVTPISEERARLYTGHYYVCPKGKRPFLVRGLVGFAGTGHFRAYRVGTAIWVSHESLGDQIISSRTALVVNLDFEPSSAYVTVSIIQ